MISSIKHLIDIKNFDILHKINKGAYGSVYCIRNKKTNLKYAAKKISQPQSKNNSIEKEIEIMIRLQHQTLIKFYGYSLQEFDGENYILLILELAEKGSLQDVLNKTRLGISDELIDNTVRQKILFGISRGMMYLY